MSVGKGDKRALTPKLRFPEFRKTDGWALTRMGDLISLEYGESLPEKSRRTGPVPVMGSNGVVGYHKDALIKGPAIIIGRKGSVGQVTWVDSDCFPIDTTFYVENKKPSKISIRFLHRLLQVSGLENRRDLGAVPGLNRNDVHSLGTAIPDPAEQQKIADCLTSLDELIAAQGRKVEALKVHKKGLMQQLFPREGETIPRLRFPEFRAAPNWEEKKLDEVAQRGSGHTPSKTHSEYYNGGIKWVSLADSKRLDNGFISNTAIEISEEGIANSSAVLHAAGTVILSRDAGIGKSAVMEEAMAVSQHFMVWTCNTTLLSNWFLYYLFQLMKPRFESVASGSTIKTIGLQFFINLQIIAPAILEQQRIADCLSTLDARIAAEADKRSALKTHKAGLMQQLFPSTEGD